MTAAPRIIGRYALHGEIASGGMATVHFGRLLGPVGFSRTVAIKRLHPQFAKDPEFVSMFLDEARLAARVQHPNVVATLDVVTAKGELFLVMEYVAGETLSRLVRRVSERGAHVPPRVVAAIMCGVLQGLHAAHEAKNQRGEPLSIVHRDVSPQNVLVGIDGTAKIVDFGVAKASGRAQHTAEGVVKGKIAYMAPEQVQGEVSRKTDVYSAGVVAWEMLTARRLFVGDSGAATMAKVLQGKIPLPSSLVPGLPQAYDRVVMRAVEADPARRFATAREMALALEKCGGLATPSEVGDWVAENAPGSLANRAEAIHEIESGMVEVASGASIFEQLRSSPPPPPSGRPATLTTITIARPVTPHFVGPPRAEPASQPSTLTLVTSSLPAARPAPPRRKLWAGFAGLGLLAATLFAVGVHRTAAPGPAAAPVPIGSATSAALAGATVAVAQREPETIASVAKESAVNQLAQPAASVTAKLAAGSARKGKMPASAASSRKKPLSSGCDPPYLVDAAGHKKYKLECL